VCVVDNPEEVFGHFSLQLSMLVELRISEFHDVKIELECSQLKSLFLDSLEPLQAFSGMPRDLEAINLLALQGGSLPLESICCSQKLAELKGFKNIRLFH
jgi:hypothetical protein